MLIVISNYQNCNVASTVENVIVVGAIAGNQPTSRTYVPTVLFIVRDGKREG